MITSNVNISAVSTEPARTVKYPVLAKSNDGHIVWFTDETTGTILQLPEKPSKSYVGQNLTNWFNIHRSDIWTILPVGSCVQIIQGTVPESVPTVQIK